MHINCQGASHTLFSNCVNPIDYLCSYTARVHSNISSITSAHSLSHPLPQLPLRHQSPCLFPAATALPLAAPTNSYPPSHWRPDYKTSSHIWSLTAHSGGLCLLLQWWWGRRKVNCHGPKVTNLPPWQAW